MPVDEEKSREAMEVGDLIHAAANIVENAIRTDNPGSKKALQNAAKALLQDAISRLDESVGTAIAGEEDDE